MRPCGWFCCLRVTNIPHNCDQPFRHKNSSPSAPTQTTCRQHATDAHASNHGSQPWKHIRIIVRTHTQIGRRRENTPVPKERIVRKDSTMFHQSKAQQTRFFRSNGQGPSKARPEKAHALQQCCKRGSLVVKKSEKVDICVATCTPSPSVRYLSPCIRLAMCQMPVNRELEKDDHTSRLPRTVIDS